MTTTAVLRLLNYGLPGLRSAGERAAEAFSPNELAASPLALDAPPADLSGDVDASSENDWRETSPDGDLHLLERPWPGLHAPLYLAGHATSSLDVAQALAHRNLLPEWGAVLVLGQSAGRWQLRRAWASPPGNIYAALRLPTAWPLNTEAAATAVGGLFASALTQLGYAVSLKWPNDILQVQNEEFSTSPDGASVRPCSATAWVKAGGILLEERGGVLLAGVGLNISSAPPASALREGFALPAGVLRHAPAPPPAPTVDHTGIQTGFIPLLPLWTRLAGLVFSCYFQKNIGTETSWWPALAQRHLAFHGCRVRLEDALPEHDSGAERSFCEGVVEGLCVSGALRLRVKSDVLTFLGGSLIPLE